MSWWPWNPPGGWKVLNKHWVLAKVFSEWICGGGGRNYSSPVHSGGLPQLRIPLQGAVAHTSGPLHKPRNAGDDTPLQWGPELEEAS